MPLHPFRRRLNCRPRIGQLERQAFDRQRVERTSGERSGSALLELFAGDTRNGRTPRLLAPVTSTLDMSCDSLLRLSNLGQHRYERAEKSKKRRKTQISTYAQKALLGTLQLGDTA